MSKRKPTMQTRQQKYDNRMNFVRMVTSAEEISNWRLLLKLGNVNKVYPYYRKMFEQLHNSIVSKDFFLLLSRYELDIDDDNKHKLNKEATFTVDDICRSPTECIGKRYAKDESASDAVASQQNVSEQQT